MLRRYFGFSEDPFGATPDPRCLYCSHTHREALASLKYGFFSNRGFTALIAPPGMGKTTLLFRFLDEIRESARSVFLFDIDSQCEPRELVGYILRDLGITPGATSAEMHDQLSSVLVAEAKAGRRLVVVIDEAQNLSVAALEMVRLLTNFETPRAKLMQIVLAGQAQLSEKLMQPSLVQLRQRISTVCRLEPLSAEETTAYIDHRLKFAGYVGDPLFTKDALKEITETSQGIPRAINTLCFNSLSLCCALKRKQVDGRMVAEAIADQQLTLPPKQVYAAASEAETAAPRKPKRRPRVSRWAKIWVPAAAVLLVVSVVGMLRFSRLRRDSAMQQSYAKILAVSPSTPNAANSRQSKDDEPSPKVEPLGITVEPNQTLRKIARQYLGGADFKRLQQIQDLNPNLIDPNHIEPGQRIKLPEPLATPVAENVTPSTDERNTP